MRSLTNKEILARFKCKKVKSRASCKARNEGCDTKFFALCEIHVPETCVVGFDFIFG